MDGQWKKLSVVLGVGIASGIVVSKLLIKEAGNGADKVEGADRNKRIVEQFFKAQSERDLNKMCDLVANDILYINEPHPENRHIRNKEKFREAFAHSPCIWCEEANLKVKQISHEDFSDTVFFERLDQFKIDNIWLKVPICGFIKIKHGKIKIWKDYWDYKKYKSFVETNYGKDFNLFRKTLPGNA